jgi:hypothetical protein
MLLSRSALSRNGAVNPIASALSRSYFEDRVNFNGDPTWERGYTYGTARVVAAGLAKDFLKRVRCTIRHLRMLIEVLGGVDEHAQLDSARYPFQAS